MESADNSVPLLERLKFLSIYSSNLDEFYRVRIPTLKSLKKLEKESTPSRYAAILSNIGKIVSCQMKELGNILENKIIPALKAHKIHLLYNEPIPGFLQKECTDYFYNHVAGYLQPVFLDEKSSSLLIENNKLQLLVILETPVNEEQLAIVNIPADFLPRFYAADDNTTGTRFIIFLDDIVKANLDHVFTGFTVKASYSFKITRDAALDLQDEFDGDIADKIERQLKKRNNGLASRFLYQPGISLRILYSVFDKLNLRNANAIPGGNYHNLKDLSAIPIANPQLYLYEPWEPVNKEMIEPEQSVFNKIASSDIIVHTPYQSFLPVLRFFNEAAVDKMVEEIYVTIYRVANDSMVVHSLISAAKVQRLIPNSAL